MFARLSLTFALACVVATSLGCHRAPEAVSAARALLDAARVPAVMAAQHAAEEAALQAGRTHVAETLDACNVRSSDFWRRALLVWDRVRPDESIEPILVAWPVDQADPDVADVLIRYWSRIGEHDAARRVAWESANAHAARRAHFMQRYLEAFAADPAFLPPTIQELTASMPYDRLEAFPGSSSVILKARAGGETVAAFKPHQTLRHQSYRGEIAAWRLCEVLHCDVRVVPAAEVRIERDDFFALARISEDTDTGFYSNRSDVIWSDDDAGDTWLYGVVKPWISGLNRFPIEYTDVWRPWLAQPGGWRVDALRVTSMREAIGGLAGRERGQFERLVRLADGLSAYDLAHQLSDLAVLDVLVNNFDRYQSGLYLGMNCHFVRGSLVSLDNGAAFLAPEVHHDRSVRRRAAAVERYSRATIDALRWIDPEMLFPLLFPPSTVVADERPGYDAFLERRAWLLDHVDGLIATYGDEAVLVFP